MTQDGERATLDHLIGTMSNYSADFGLLVSWSGFKSSVMKEILKQFFKVRLWDPKIIIQQIFENYEKFSDEIKKEIPIKRVWMEDGNNSSLDILIKNEIERVLLKE